MAKTSLLAESPKRELTVAPLLLPRHVLLFPPLHQLSLRLLLLAPPTPPWLDTWKMTPSGSIGPFWILDFLHLFRLPLSPPLRTMRAHVIGLWKLGTRTFIEVKRTWSATISSSSAKITSLPPVPQVWIEFYLRLFTWRTPPCSAGSNTSVRWRIKLTSLSAGSDSRSSCAKA